MKLYIITIRIKHGLKHNPREKEEGICPQLWGSDCTDKTGEHHSFLMWGESISYIKNKTSSLRVTRIETAHFMNGSTIK